VAWQAGWIKSEITVWRSLGLRAGKVGPLFCRRGILLPRKRLKTALELWSAQCSYVVKPASQTSFLIQRRGHPDGVLYTDKRRRQRHWLRSEKYVGDFVCIMNTLNRGRLPCGTLVRVAGVSVGKCRIGIRRSRINCHWTSPRKRLACLTANQDRLVLCRIYLSSRGERPTWLVDCFLNIIWSGNSSTQTKFSLGGSDGRN